MFDIHKAILQWAHLLYKIAIHILHLNCAVEAPTASFIYNFFITQYQIINSEEVPYRRYEIIFNIVIKTSDYCGVPNKRTLPINFNPGGYNKNE